MKAFIAKSTVEELSAKLSALSPEARSKMVAAIQEAAPKSAEVEAKADEAAKPEENVQAVEAAPVAEPAAAAVELAVEAKEEPKAEAKEEPKEEPSGQVVTEAPLTPAGGKYCC